MSKKIKLAAGLFILVFPLVGFGCSMILVPITQFDSDEYILTGKVVGFVGPQKLNYVAGDAWGVLIAAAEKVHSPKTPARYFEVFPLDLEADCSSEGRSKEQLSRDYPLGSKVFVIAKEAKFNPASDGNVRLVISPRGNGLLSTLSLQEELVSTTSVYDYREYTEAQRALPIFELRKELLRLGQASSEQEKEKVLLRLVYFPERFLLDYKQIVELHLKDKGLAAQLIAEREAWMQRHIQR